MNSTRIIFIIVLAVVQALSCSTMILIGEEIEKTKNIAEKIYPKQFDLADVNPSILSNRFALESEISRSSISVSSALDMIPVKMRNVEKFDTSRPGELGLYALLGLFPIAALVQSQGWLKFIIPTIIYFVVFGIASNFIKRPIGTDSVLSSLHYHLAVVQSFNEKENIQIKEYAYSVDSWITIENCMHSMVATSKTAQAVSIASNVVAFVIALGIGG